LGRMLSSHHQCSYMDDRFIGEILTAIEHAYGSCDHPTYFFTWHPLFSMRLYKDLITAISEEFEVVEDCDWEFDRGGVCYYITKGVDAWQLRISLVGPYALLMRTSDHIDPDEVVSQTSPILYHDDRRLLELISIHGVRVLSTAELNYQIPLRLSVDGSNACLFHALFAYEITDWFPWE